LDLFFHFVLCGLRFLVVIISMLCMIDLLGGFDISPTKGIFLNHTPNKKTG